MFTMFRKKSSSVFRIFAITIALSVVGLTPTSAANTNPQRIISLSPSATETLFAIGAGPQVIAVDDLSNFPASAPISKLSAFSPNVEALLNYKPDLIILNADATKALEVKAALEKLKIKVFLEKAPKDLSQAYVEITALGRATGNLANAQTVVTTMKSKIRAAIKSGRKAKKISFFHELDNTLYTATSDTFIGKVYKDFNLINIAPQISFSTAASLGCRFATSYRGLVKRAKVKKDEKVVVFGCGGVGLSAIMIAKAKGAVVYAVDVNDEALAIATSLGAQVINSKSIDAISFMQNLGGADIAIDALGSEATAGSSILCLARGGRHLQLGLMLTPTGLSAIPMARVIAWELDLLGSHGMAAKDYPEMLELVASGVLNPDLLVKREISLEEGALALADLANQPSAGITIINPGMSKV